MSNDPTYIDDVTFLTETDKAILVELPSGAEKWIPKSVIHEDSEIYGLKGEETGRLAVHTWFAEKEGLE